MILGWVVIVCICCFYESKRKQAALTCVLHKLLNDQIDHLFESNSVFIVYVSFDRYVVSSDFVEVGFSPTHKDSMSKENRTLLERVIDRLWGIKLLMI